jgi:hypothetical protein
VFFLGRADDLTVMVEQHTAGAGCSLVDGGDVFWH